MNRTDSVEILILVCYAPRVAEFLVFLQKNSVLVCTKEIVDDIKGDTMSYNLVVFK